MTIINALNDFLWGWGVSIPIILFGVFATVMLRAPWARLFKRMMKAFHAKNTEGGASPFGTLCAALGGQIGTGNVIGVATCIAAGGPGALFWMWITALLGMSTMFSETVLGQLYKEKNSDGTFRGGLPYFIKGGMHNKWLAIISACILAIGVGIVNAMSHVNGIYNAVNTVIPCSPLLIGVLLAAFAAIIIGGGFKKLANFAQAVVPFMAIAYILLALYVVISNAAHLPAMFGMIFKSAFNFSAVGGGVLGYTVQQAFRYGMARGIFSNEAGQGTVSSTASSATVAHPVVQALLSMVGVAVDTLLVCTATGLIILLSGVDYSALSGAALTQAAFAKFFGAGAPWIISITLLFFAFTSLLASFWVGQVNFRFIFQENKTALKIYFAVQILVTALAALLSVDEMFALVDCLSGFMCFFNLIALVFLFKQVKSCMADYEAKLRVTDDPAFDWNEFRAKNGMEPFPQIDGKNAQN